MKTAKENTDKSALGTCDPAPLAKGGSARRKGRYACAMRPGKWQRNAILEAVVAGGLDARECWFDYDDVAWRITHVPSGSYLLIDGAPSPYTVTVVVGEDLPWTTTFYTWPSVDERVQRWARDVKRDVDTPDLWAEIRRGQGILNGAGYEEVENSPFSSDEQTEIVKQFREITDYVRKTYSPSAAQMLSIETKLDDIAAAARRAGRQDWRLMFGGVILGWVLSDFLPREVLWDILSMAFQGLGHLFGGSGRPLQLPPGV